MKPRLSSVTVNSPFYFPSNLLGNLCQVEVDKRHNWPSKAKGFFKSENGRKNAMSPKITFGKCPLCGVYDLLVESGFMLLCRSCRRKMIRLLEEADKRGLTLEEVMRILAKDFNEKGGD